jgi:hypothetical protein
MDSANGAHHSALNGRVVIAFVFDAVPRKVVMNAKLANFVVTEQQAVGANEPVILNGHYYRNPVAPGLYQYRWRGGKVKIMYMNNVGFEIVDGVTRFSCRLPVVYGSDATLHFMKHALCHFAIIKQLDAHIMPFGSEQVGFGFQGGVLTTCTLQIAVMYE